MTMKTGKAQSMQVKGHLLRTGGLDHLLQVQFLIWRHYDICRWTDVMSGICFK